MRSARILGITALLTGMLLAGCGGKNNKLPPVGANAAPDKVLYDRALIDIDHGRYDTARLTLQTLINTYPDSEYLAKAKMSIADAYYKEGGSSNLTQAANEYNDFITFFPFLEEETAYAQMQIGRTHYRRVEKPDRDRTEAQLAEQAFQVFLQKYPSSKLVPQVTQELRNVQEILAEGDFRIASYYNTKGAYRAAAGRLLDVASRYPLYSKSDKALWMLGNIYQKNEKTQIAGAMYARIVREYPLSDMVPDAKAQLTKMGVPVPQPDPAALARMQAEQNLDTGGPGLLHRVMDPLRSAPDMSTAARTGMPNLNPPDDTSDLETLAATASATGMNVTAGTSGSGTTGETTGGTSGNGNNAAVVQTVTPGSAPAPNPTGTPATDPAGAQPPAGGSEAAPPATPNNPSGTPASPTPNGNAAPGTTNPDGSTAPLPVPCAESGKNKGKTPDGKPCKVDSKESSSKKKKGLKKLIPW